MKVVLLRKDVVFEVDGSLRTGTLRRLALEVSKASEKTKIVLLQEIGKGENRAEVMERGVRVSHFFMDSMLRKGGVGVVVSPWSLFYTEKELRYNLRPVEVLLKWGVVPLIPEGFVFGDETVFLTAEEMAGILHKELGGEIVLCGDGGVNPFISGNLYRELVK